MLEHGGDILGYKAEYGHTPLDFSVNTNPLGMPPGAVRAAAAALENAQSYPDPLCRELRGAIAKAERVEPEHIFCGNGAADVIWRLVQAVRPRTALVTAPAFAEYESALNGFDCAIECHFLREAAQFRVEEGILSHIHAGLDMVFLCEPANPTGQLTEPALMRRILARCAQTGTRLVVDECFNGFLDEPAAHTLVPLLGEHPHLVVLKAFTKLYAMAGLRLGYGLCADEALLAGLAAAGQPWPVSGVAQAAGIAALADTAYPGESRRFIGAQRQWLKGQLEAHGCRVYASHANYLFFRAPREDLHHALAREGILIRNCANYKGLGPGYYRVAVGTVENNRQLAAALSRCLPRPFNEEEVG